MAYNMYIERMGKRPAPMLVDYAKLLEKNMVYGNPFAKKTVRCLDQYGAISEEFALGSRLIA